MLKLPPRKSSRALLSPKRTSFVDMTELERTVDALKAAVKQGGIDKRVSDVVNQFTSYLVLLVCEYIPSQNICSFLFQKSSSPSSQSISKLRSILRRPLVPLYTDFPEPALKLSSAVLRKVIDEKLRNALNVQNSQLIASWNEVAVALLSGVLVRTLFLSYCGLT